ncbi:signal peptidase I [Paenibacillus glycanilyticus]|uniref:signal peptidase I n=1 Tax=Paenibacillus glycanilyticus TaxID=126569 RepID=UPI001910F308|nr:signal peptidase I [Paenibacillus glycanilyticus]
MMFSVKVSIFLLTFVFIIIISGCTETISDTITEEKIKLLENPSSTLSKVKVTTDGMLSAQYDYPHPFGVGNEVLVDMTYYNQHDLSRGDIVVFKTKNLADQETDIARIVGLPNEIVSINKGQVYINGKKLAAFYGNDSTSDKNASWDPVTLKENEYYILADVRWRGLYDSQTAGPFIKQDIIGKVIGYDKQ